MGPMMAKLAAARATRILYPENTPITVDRTVGKVKSGELAKALVEAYGWAKAAVDVLRTAEGGVYKDKTDEQLAEIILNHRQEKRT